MNICPDVQDICEPLFKCTPVEAFLYTELFPDGSRAEVGTHYDHFELTYVTSKYMKQVYTAEFLPTSNIIYVPTWVESTKNINLKSQLVNQANYLNLGNELCLIKRRKSHYEYYHFYSLANNEDAYSFYLDKLSIFQHFCIYFHHKAARFIREARRNKILQPWRKICQLDILPADSQFEEFLKQTKIKRFYLNDTLEDYLTEQEMQCVIHLLNNKTAKEISQAICLSQRTVENYLASIKSKLHCHKRSDLITKLLTLDLQYLIPHE